MPNGKLLNDYDRLETMHQKLKDAQLESQASPIAILQLPRDEIGHLLHLVQKYINKSNHRAIQTSPQRKRKRADPKNVPKKVKKPKHNRPPPPKSYLCRRCKISGHWLDDCAMKPEKRPPNGYVCHRCNRPGHWIKDCPAKATPRQPPPGYVCHCCGATDHYIKDCSKKGTTQQSRQRSRSPAYSPPPRRVVKPEPIIKKEEHQFAGPVSNMLQGPGPSTSELDLLEQLLGGGDVSNLLTSNPYMQTEFRY